MMSITHLSPSPDGYVKSVGGDGTIVQLGAPAKSIEFSAYQLIFQRKRLSGRLIGGREEIGEMLQLAADMDIRPWAERRPTRDASRTIVDLGDSKARFRYALVN